MYLVDLSATRHLAAVNCGGCQPHSVDGSESNRAFTTRNDLIWSNIMNSGWELSAVIDFACDRLTPNPGDRSKALAIIQNLWYYGLFSLSFPSTYQRSDSASAYVKMRIDRFYIDLRITAAGTFFVRRLHRPGAAIREARRLVHGSLDCRWQKIPFRTAGTSSALLRLF
jgi:hypothetical protein